jgi:hypothetical protein
MPLDRRDLVEFADATSNTSPSYTLSVEASTRTTDVAVKTPNRLARELVA